VFVVAARDLAVFSLGTLPDDTRGRRRAEDLAARLHAALGGARVSHGEAGRALGVPPNRLRYASATGTVVIRGCSRAATPTSSGRAPTATCWSRTPASVARCGPPAAEAESLPLPGQRRPVVVRWDG
jgi:hypothetical protein